MALAFALEERTIARDASILDQQALAEVSRHARSSRIPLRRSRISHNEVREHQLASSEHDHTDLAVVFDQCPHAVDLGASQDIDAAAQKACGVVAACPHDREVFEVHVHAVDVDSR